MSNHSIITSMLTQLHVRLGIRSITHVRISLSVSFIAMLSVTEMLSAFNGNRNIRHIIQPLSLTHSHPRPGA